MGTFLGKNGKTAVLFGAFALGLYLGFQYLLPLAWPFVLAFFVVYVLYPGLERVRKKLPVRREILLASLLTALAVLLFVLLWFVIRRSADWVSRLYQNLVLIENQLTRWLHGGCMFLQENFGIDAGEAEEIIIERLEVFVEQLQINVWPTAAKQSFSYLKKIGTAAAFCGIAFIAALLLCKDYDRLVMRCRSQPLLQMIWQFAEKTVRMICGYVRAQLLIICAVSATASAGLWISGVNGAWVWGLLAGFLDALPFIGTSVVLLPLSLWQLLNGEVWTGAGIIVCYIVCVIVREFLEPRLLGRQLGISPVIMLFSVYAGVKVFGITGLFLGPLYVMLLREGCRMYCASRQQRADGEEWDEE